MKAIQTMTMVALLLCSAMPVLAETTLIDLDSAPGNYSVWKVSDFTASSVRFSATYAGVKAHENWAPSYKITLSDGHEQRVVFTGTYQASEVPEVTAVATKSKKDVDLGESILSFKLKKTYAVELSWTADKLKVIANGATHEYDVAFRPTEIEVLCSTGELEVKNITFGK